MRHENVTRDDSFDAESSVGNEKTLTVGINDVEVSTKCGKDVIMLPESACNRI